MDAGSTAPDATGPLDERAGKPPVEISLADFSDVIVGMSRLLYELARIAPFRDSALGLAEWVALSVLAEQGPMSNQQLGRALGVSPQRADQLKSSLREAGYISVRQSREDARKNVIMITDRGKTQLRTLNLKLRPIIEDALKDREQTLGIMKRSVRIMMRVVQRSRQ